MLSKDQQIHHNFVKLVKSLSEEIGSERAFAQRIGIGHGAPYQWKQGSFPTLEMLIKIANYKGLSMERLGKVLDKGVQYLPSNTVIKRGSGANLCSPTIEEITNSAIAAYGGRQKFLKGTHLTETELNSLLQGKSTLTTLGFLSSATLSISDEKLSSYTLEDLRTIAEAEKSNCCT